MDGCQNSGSLVDPCNTAPNIWGTQKGTIIVTTIHIGLGFRDGPAAVDPVQNVIRDWACEL